MTNPTTHKVSLKAAEVFPRRRYRPAALIGVFFSCVALAMTIGVAGNFMGAMICPEYYTLVLRWDVTENLTRAIVGQGLFESSITGAVLGIVYVLIVGIVTRAECPWRVAAGHLWRWALWMPAFYLTGALVAVCLYAFSPGQMLNMVGDLSMLTPRQQAGFFWIGGSIDGTYAGGLIVTMLACLTIKRKWRRFRLQSQMERHGWSARCLKCGYDLRRHRRGTCPECGTPAQIIGEGALNSTQETAQSTP